MSFIRSISRRPTVFPTLLAAALVTGCGGPDFTSTTEPVTGPGTVYALATVDNRQLPVVFTDPNNQTQTEVRKGALTLSPDSSFIFSLALRSNAGGIPSTSTNTLRGSFTRSGTELTLVQGSDTLFNGAYSPNNVALNLVSGQVTGQAFVFIR